MNFDLKADQITCSADDFISAETAVIGGFAAVAGKENLLSGKRAKIAEAILGFAEKYNIDRHDPNLGKVILEKMKSDTDLIIQAAAFKVQSILQMAEIESLKAKLAGLEQTKGIEGYLKFGSDLMHTLATLGTSLMVLEELTVDDPIQKEILADAISAANLFTVIVRKLHNASFCIDTDRENILNLNGWIKEILAGLNARTGNYNIQIDLDPDPELEILKNKALPRKLKIAIANLIVNGVDAIERKAKTGSADQNQSGSDSRSTLKISYRILNDKLHLSVSDSGDGIKEEDQKSVFDPFFTTRPPDKKKGSGLGLTEAYGLVKQAGGEIHFQTISQDMINSNPDAYEGLNTGTVFHIAVPLQNLF